MMKESDVKDYLAGKDQDCVNILHLSDLYFKHTTIPDSTLTKTAERENVIENLLETLKSIDDFWKPNIIIILGDIAWAGKADDYKLAEIWLTKLMDLLTIEPRNIIILGDSYHRV